MLFKKTLTKRDFANAIVDHVVRSTIHEMNEFNDGVEKLTKNYDHDARSLQNNNLERLMIAAIVLEMQTVHNALGPYAFVGIRKYVLERLSTLDLMAPADIEDSFYRYQIACDNARDKGILPVGHTVEDVNLSSVLYDEIHLPHMTLSTGFKAQIPTVHLAITGFFMNVTGIAKHILESYRIKR